MNAEDPAQPKDTGELRFLAVFFSLFAVGMAGLFAALRTGFGSDGIAIFRALGLALLLVNAPVMWADTLRRNGRAGWYRSPAAGGLLLTLLTCLGGLPVTAHFAGILFALLGMAAAAWTAMRAFRAGDVRIDARFTATLVLAILWCGGVTWGTGYENPLYLENVALHGQRRSIDLFFHSGLANMLTTYGVPSNGIDGLVGISYHFGSHWVFGRWAALMGVQVIDFYQMGYQVVVPAVWFMGLAMVALEVRRRRGHVGAGSYRGIALILVCAAVVGSLPWPPLAAGGFGVSPFLSESHALAILLGFYVGAIVLARVPAHEGALAEYFLACVLVPLTITALGFMKVSTFAFTLPALLYGVLRTGLYRRAAWIAGTLLTLAAVYLSLPRLLQPIFLGAGAVPKFALFSYLDYLLPVRWWPFFITIHFFWSWIFILVRLRQEGVTNFQSLRLALKRKSLIDAEIIVLTTLACMAPGMILPISMDAFFFSDQARWAALPLLLGDGILLARLSAKLRDFRGDGYFRLAPSRIAALFLAGPLIISFVITLLAWPISMLRMNLSTRKEIAALTGEPLMSVKERVRSGRILELFDSRMLAAGLANAPGTSVIQTLRTASEISRESKKHTAVYIPKSIGEFWDIYQSAENCNWAGFVAPALSEVAMINGIPPRECSVGRNFGYGMSSYMKGLEWPPSVVKTDSELCADGERWGFNDILIMEPVSAHTQRRQFKLRKLSCGMTS